MNNRKKFLAAALLLATCSIVHAGTWGIFTPITDDTNAGVVGGTTYTTAVDVGGSGITINGVMFDWGMPTGTGYSFDGDWQDALIDNLTGVSGEIASLLSNSRRPNHFHGFYNSDLTLNGLTPATDYVTTFYFPGTTASGVLGSGSDEFVVPSGLDSTLGYYVTYSFTATDSTKTFTLPAGGSEDVKIAGFSNCIAGGVPPDPTPASWNITGSGDWNRASNWTGGTVPNAPGATAILGDKIDAFRNVYSDDPVSVGTLKFDSPNTYNLVGHSLFVEQAFDSTEPASIQVLQGSHKINLPLTFASDTDISVQNAGDVLAISDPVTVNSGITLTKSGEGTLLIESTWTGGAVPGAVNVVGGILQVNTAGGLPAGIGLSIGDGGTVVLAGGLTASGTAAAQGAVSAVPEPGTMLLLAVAAVLLALRTLRRR